MGRGLGVRCFGYLDDTGFYARCTREDKAGGLPQNSDSTFSHRLRGRCDCGDSHGDAATPTDEARHAGTWQAHRKRTEQRFRSYFTLASFLRRFYGEGASVRSWVYRDSTGQERFRIVRIDFTAPGGATAKSYRPCHQGVDGRWRLGKPDGLLPLYDLPGILATPPEGIVTLLEGEKCADIASGLGLNYTTTSAHGAQAPQLTDWSPLAGRQVVILRDEGNCGQEYAAKVAAILSALDPPATVSFLRMPGLSDGEDIEQWVASRHAAGLLDDAILAELLLLIESARG